MKRACISTSQIRKGRRRKPLRVLFEQPQHDQNSVETESTQFVNSTETGVEAFLWFFGACAEVCDGIQRDRGNVAAAIEEMKGEYAFFKSVSSSQKRFAEIELKLASMESHMNDYPLEVIKTMCNDMGAVLEKGNYGALEMLRSTGARGAEEDLVSPYLLRWKRALYKRSVWEYLVLTEQQSKWPGLLSGVETERKWLKERMHDVMGNEVADDNTAEFITEMLFPNEKDNVTGPLSSMMMSLGMK